MDPQRARPAFGPHYHVGIVVADVDGARARLSGLLGVTWGPVLHMGEVAYRDGAGTELSLPTSICYSTGNPALELIEEQAGTVWTRNEHSNLHHIGYWSDQLGPDSDRFGAAGCPLQLCGRDTGAGPASFAYHRDDGLGIRIELVDASLRESMGFLFQPDDTAP